MFPFCFQRKILIQIEIDEDWEEDRNEKERSEGEQDNSQERHRVPEYRGITNDHGTRNIHSENVYKNSHTPTDQLSTIPFIQPIHIHDCRLDPEDPIISHTK